MSSDDSDGRDTGTGSGTSDDGGSWSGASSSVAAGADVVVASRSIANGDHGTHEQTPAEQRAAEVVGNADATREDVEGALSGLLADARQRALLGSDGDPYPTSEHSATLVDKAVTFIVADAQAVVDNPVASAEEVSRAISSLLVP